MWKKFSSRGWCLFIAVCDYVPKNTSVVIAIDVCDGQVIGRSVCDFSFYFYMETGLKLFKDKDVPEDMVKAVKDFRNNPFFEIDLNKWLAKRDLIIKRWL